MSRAASTHTAEAASPARASVANSVSASALHINRPGDFYEQEADRVADQVMANSSATTPARKLNWSLSKVSLQAPIQRKLEVGAVDDPLERKADRVADEVMRGNAPAGPAASTPMPISRNFASSSVGLQRKCACGGAASDLTGECEACGSKRMGALQTKLQINEPGDAFEREADRVAAQVTSGQAPHGAGAAPRRIQRYAPPGNGHANAAPASVAGVLGRPGSPLDAGSAHEMGFRFGYDFSGVRVHTGSLAANSADELNAEAYTVGSDIVFGANRYSPDTMQGRRLLAHELTHVVQQSRGPAAPRTIRRQARRHDQCTGKGPDNPCAKYEDSKEQSMLKPYLHTAKDFGGLQLSAGLTTLEAVLGTGKGPVERARLLRIACCRLEPEDAVAVKTAFEKRQGTAGKTFHELAPPTQCDLLWILKDRSERAGASSVEAHRRDVVLQQAANQQRHDEAIRAERDRKRAEDEQFKQDKENLDKAGQIGILDVLMPAHTQPYRIQYADRIKNPYLKFQAQVTERGANVPVGRAAAEPILRPTVAFASFVDCFIHALRREDFEKVGNTMDLAFEVVMPVSFGSGVAVGAAEEVGRLAKQVLDNLIHPLEMVHDIVEMIKLVENVHVQEIFCALGQDMGAAKSKEIGGWADEGRVELAYKLGEMAGPFLLNTIIAIVAPEVAALLESTLIGRRMLAIFKDIGEVLEVISKWKKEVATVEHAGAAEAKVASRAAGAEAKIASHAASAEKTAVRTEEVIGDAEAYLEKHPPKHIEGTSPGERHAELEGGKHSVQEVKDEHAPGGIACEFHSPRPFKRVRCPEGMGAKPSTPEQIEEFKKRKGIDEIPRHQAPAPRGEKYTIPVKDDLPEDFEDLANPTPRTRKQANVDLGEEHHIQTKYGEIGEEGKAILEEGGIGIEDDLNKIKDFEEHGQLRGWEEWDDVNKTYKHQLHGHHPGYKKWVLKLLRSAVEGHGLTKEMKRDRLERVLAKIRQLLQKYPEILTHGPDISPRISNLKFRFKK